MLHPGHVKFLTKAAKLGDRLHVLLNDDESVEWLKGKGRPHFPAEDRQAMLEALQCVDKVTNFKGLRITTHIKRIKPDIYVKGGDYDLSKLNVEEYKALQEIGTKIVFIDQYKDYSTTKLCQK